jgi:hypothetical protein
MSSYKTAEYDILTARTIRAANLSTNVVPPAYTALMSDGIGGAFWSTLSTKRETNYPFQVVSTTARNFIADASFNTIRFINADAVRFSTANYSTLIYTNTFQNLSIANQSTISFSTLRFSTSENFAFSTTNNTLFFQVPNTYLNNLPISTNIYIAGADGIRIQQTDQIYPIEISSFTSNGFVAMSNNYNVITIRLPSSLSNAYAPKTVFSTSVQYISTQSGLGIQQLVEANSTTQASTISSFFEFSTIFLSTLHASNTSTISSIQTSSLAYCLSSLSSFSSLTSLLLESTTIASTNSIFSQTTFFSSPTVPLSSFFINLRDTVSTASTAVSIYDYLEKTSDFLSSSKSLLHQTNAISTQIVSTFAIQASSFSTTFTSTAEGYSLSTGKLISYNSTMPYTVYTPTFANGTNFHITLSTAALSLSTLSSQISSITRVFVQYNPLFTFSNFMIYISDNVVSKNTFPVCTFLQMGASTVPGTLFRDQIQTYTDIPNSVFRLPYYSRHMRFEVPTSYITNSSLVFTHTFNNIAYVDRAVSARNSDGGIVRVASFFENCAHELTTQTLWSNATNPSTSVSIFVQNALLS